MSEASLRRLIDAWSASETGLTQAESDRRILGFTALVRAIAERGAAAPDEFARSAGMPVERVLELFQALAAAGLQLDADGHVVGAALTARPTPHRLRVQGRDLYAWCSLDTLFLPGLLDEAAEVRSTCPVSGEEIRLSVTPDGVESVSPAGTVLSVVDPQALGADQGTGPASPT